MMNIYWLRPKIGDAVWLWMLLGNGVNFKGQDQEKQEWFSVNDGKPISDIQLGSHLFCTADIVKDWRERLEAAGVIRTTLEPDTTAKAGFESRTYEVVNLIFGAKNPEAPLATQSIN